jgi:hypothetical protein
MLCEVIQRNTGRKVMHWFFGEKTAALKHTEAVAKGLADQKAARISLRQRDRRLLLQRRTPERQLYRDKLQRGRFCDVLRFIWHALLVHQ